MSATFYVGDAIEVMDKLPEKSVDLILTSPPFLALRSYLPSDHPDKALEGGSQATPGEFIDWLVDVVEACDRILAPHGSLCIELGDTYSGSGGAGGDYGDQGLREGEPKFDGSGRRNRPADVAAGILAPLKRPGLEGRDRIPGWPLAKSLSLIPELFRLTLVYGTNPLTGRTTERWRLRNVVRWVRPNPPVGALGDKFRPATSELMVFCKSAKRYFDLDSVRSVADSPRTTNGTPLGAATVREEVRGTIYAGDASSMARWWCDLGESEIPVVLPVTRLTDNFEVVELIGLQVGLEQAERSYVVDLQTCRGSTASPTDIAITVERFLPGTFPIGSAVTDASTTPCGAVLASPVGRTPSAIALETAEVLGVKGRFIASDRLAARIALKVNDTICYALLIAPITASDHQANSTKRPTTGGKHDGKRTPLFGDRGGSGFATDPAGAPPLDWWNIPPGGYEGAHYAVFPPELCIKPIKAMCPEKVCRVCGEPSRRISEATYFDDKTGEPREGRSWVSGMSHGNMGAHSLKSPAGDRNVLLRGSNTLGWTDCGHDDYRPGLVLDPFGGSGTTALVATGHGRDCILIDLDPRNFDLALDRVGPFILTLGSL